MPIFVIGVIALIIMHKDLINTSINFIAYIDANRSLKNSEIS